MKDRYSSYEQRIEDLSKLKAFSQKNKPNFNKRDTLLHEISRHREKQAESIKLRKQWLDRQKIVNYKNEYERLMGAMTKGVVKETSNKYIQERMGRLKDLAREAIHGKSHDIYTDKKDEEKTDEQKMRELNKKLARNRPNRIHNTLIVTPAGSSSTVYA